MSQLVIKPGIATPFGVAAHHAGQQAHQLVATWLAAIDRIGHWSRGPGAHPGHLERPTRARMSREMYRL
ncbi:hypothetical protein [Mycolicibacter kumamotonensis]|jgi:hypothetical protein|uniref:Uncharacterized protein n=1 Tax=Mycolicibacter kumamotonensis TaxID=354243 RepID=A0A1B8SH19_9MYCO|nr:hypothetical protein [Mycolicibacter kumamotonensis]NDJ88829.1 hypothetical protein [Mycolicibacter kumamotonensis]OBY32027.1 hypothetical protein ACT18_09875 [Mycolicibacter kumamotonensis]